MGMSGRKPNNWLNYRSLFCVAWRHAWRQTFAVIKTKCFLATVFLFGVINLLYLNIWGFSHAPSKGLDGFVTSSDWNLGEFLNLTDQQRINYIRRLAPANFHRFVPLNETAHDGSNLILAFDLLASMNASVGPCEDFYEFACGNSGHAAVNNNGHFRETLNALRHRAKEILENWNVTTRSSQSRPMDLAANFYTQCSNKSHNRTEAAIGILNSLGGWPSIDPSWTEEKFQFLPTIAKARRNYTRSPFFVIFVYIHPEDSTRNIINLDIPKTSVPTDMIFTDVHNDMVSLAYKDLYVNSARHLSGLDDPQFEYEATQVYNLERRLAIAQFRESNAEPNRVMTFDEFQLEMNKVNVTASHAQVNWVQLLNEIFRSSGVSVKPDQEILVRNMDFMGKLLKILDDTDLSTLVNYMQWSIVREWFPEFSKRFDTSAANLTLVQSVGGDSAETAGYGLNNVCLTAAMDTFALPLCDEFIKQQYHFIPADRAAVDKMTTTMRESFMEMIGENNWTSDLTKFNALKKVAGMKQFVGYPDWLTKGTKLETRFEKLRLGKDRVESLINILHWKSDRHLNSLAWDSATLRDLWSRPVLVMVENIQTLGASHISGNTQSAVESMSPSLCDISPLVVNGFNLRSLNSIVIPMGMFYYSFYSGTRPACVNFGKLGWIVGHEIAHGFDTTGNTLDAQGKGTEWVSPEDRETFEGNSKCFAQQYSQYELFPGKFVDGTLTLDENISDNLGLQLAYRAYKRTVQDEELEQSIKLVGLEKLSPDQLFFLSYASSQCETASPATLKRRLLRDNHSPNRFRVIGTLQNSKEFAQAWQCPAGSVMNPKTKCDWW